jgi:hypothetical protein
MVRGKPCFHRLEYPLILILADRLAGNINSLGKIKQTTCRTLAPQ